MQRRTLALLAAAVATASLGCASAAMGGTISGQVFRDFNSNGARNAGGFVAGTSMAATDAAMAGVTVRAFDNGGTQVGEATTAADGTYSLSVRSGGTVRVEFSTPDGFEPSFAGSEAGPSVQFVDAAGASDVNYAVNVPGDYCQDNPDMVSCLQQASGIVGVAQYAGAPGAFRMPSALYPQNPLFNVQGVMITPWGDADDDFVPETPVLAPFSSIGATFGIGTDRDGNAYYGTYVKRHSPYGPEGAVNAVYKVNIATGATSTFVVLGNATLPAHVATAPTGWPVYAADGYRSDGNTNDVFHKVGRAGLGDVDVTPDGSTLLAVEMTEGAAKLWAVPIAGSGAGTTAGTPRAIPLDAPATFDGVQCLGNWHPMGIGVRGTRVLVGGVCGGDESKPVANPSDLTTATRTQAAAFIQAVDLQASSVSTVAAFGLGYAKASKNDAINTMLPWNANGSGLWTNWFDGVCAVCGLPVSQPMLANIEIMDDGDLVIGFRDRANDQTKSGAISYESSSVSPVRAPDVLSAAEILRLCRVGDGYVRENDGACGADQGADIGRILAGNPQRADSPLYYGTLFDHVDGPSDGTTKGHPYTGIGGLTSMPGTPFLWTSMYDALYYTGQGYRIYGPCPARAGDGPCAPAGAPDGAAIAATEIFWGTENGWPGNGGPGFGKGNGLGDLELVCDAAPLQIGNRVWIDRNRNGIQDPEEPVGAGVTVRLYDTAGTLAGTAVTDSRGAYYFASNVTMPAEGDGGSTGGGLVAGKAFTIRFDNAADFAAGGPLAGLTPTKADATSSVPGVMSTSVNSKASLTGGVPTIEVSAHRSGFNDHAFDAGFTTPEPAPTPGPRGVPVAVGDYAWVDANRDGRQGRAERPLKGVKVTLLTASGTERAKNRAGKPAPVATTNAKGMYLISNLAPGEYRARFEIPARYCFTKPGAKGSTVNSDPVPTKLNRRVGLTPRFVVYGEARGNTTAFSRTGVIADFANLTIDAGVATCRARGAVVTG